MRPWDQVDVARLTAHASQCWVNQHCSAHLLMRILTDKRCRNGRHWAWRLCALRMTATAVRAPTSRHRLIDIGACTSLLLHEHWVDTVRLPVSVSVLRSPCVVISRLQKRIKEGSRVCSQSDETRRCDEGLDASAQLWESKGTHLCTRL